MNRKKSIIQIIIIIISMCISFFLTLPEFSLGISIIITFLTSIFILQLELFYNQFINYNNLIKFLVGFEDYSSYSRYLNILLNIIKDVNKILKKNNNILSERL